MTDPKFKPGTIVISNEAMGTVRSALYHDGEWRYDIGETPFFQRAIAAVYDSKGGIRIPAEPDSFAKRPTIVKESNLKKWTR